MHHSSYPWNDYSLVVYRTVITMKPPGGSVYLYNGRSQDITTAMNPGIGQYVYRSGITTGLHSGRVTGLNATVNYGDGRVAGLIRTSVCAEPRRLRRPAVLPAVGLRPDLGRLRRLLLRRRHLLPASGRGPQLYGVTVY